VEYEEGEEMKVTAEHIKYWIHAKKKGEIMLITIAPCAD